MTLVFKVTASGMITLLLVLILKQHKSEYAFLVSICGSAVILYLILNSVQGYFSVLSGYLADVGIESGVLGTVLKAIGIGYITEFSASTARDFGQTSLAAKIVFAGKLGVFVLTLPFIKQLCETALTFLK